MSEPEIRKVEPPNWWIGLTPEVLLLLSGHDLRATHVGCNLPTVRVTRTEATAKGEYLFAWLKIETETRSGTAVCRVTTPTGEVAFELPLAARASKRGRFQGLSPGETRTKYAGNSKNLREELAQLKSSGATAIEIVPPTNASDFYTVGERYGQLRDLQETVAAAHDQQMRAQFDLELVRIAASHPWVANPPAEEWLVPLPRSATATPQSGVSRPDKGRTLNLENPLAVFYVLQNAVWWIESTGADGIKVRWDRRMTSQFWTTLQERLARLYPSLNVERDSPSAN